jgi:3-hydroxyisobutyrate dehydrogenase
MGVPLLGTGTVFQLYRTLQQQGLGGDGNHALVKALEHLAGMEIGKEVE